MDIVHVHDGAAVAMYSLQQLIYNIAYAFRWYLMGKWENVFSVVSVFRRTCVQLASLMVVLRFPFTILARNKLDRIS